MNESGVWKYVRDGMKNLWYATRIESSAGNGVPDLTFALKTGTCGWIELKYIRQWPKRPTTKVKLPLRPDQIAWLTLRGQYDKNLWVFVRIEDDFFLMDRDYALLLAIIDGATKERWIDEFLHWHKRVNWKQMGAALERGNR